MIPAGYMAKRVINKSDWLKASGVEDIYSMSGCVSNYFVDYIKLWKHNGYWLFDSPNAIELIAQEQSIDLAGTTMFYYEVYEKEFDEAKQQWCQFERDPSFGTDVRLPDRKSLKGYDLVTFAAQTNPGCSPLSCNSLANEIQTNSHCLLPNFDMAKHLVESGKFKDSEPGPYRIFAVYTV